MSSSFLPPTYTGFTEFEDRRLKSALALLDTPPILEQNVARYAIILLYKYFPKSIWNFVPQFYTSSRKIPDVVLETFIERAGRVRDQFFTARVYVEFKSELNTKDAIIQLLESIDLEYGAFFFSRGFLIGVKGTCWTITDYHMMENEEKKVDLLYLNFYDNKCNETLQTKRPIPSRQYKDLDSMDLKSTKESSDLIKALEWIGQGNKPKNLTSLKAKIKPLPISLTTSTLNSLIYEYKDDVGDIGKEFAHLAPFLRGELGEIDD